MADTNLLILAREFKTLRNHVQEVLKMPVGPQGLQGEKGEQGVKGDTGAPGKNGKDGKDGVNGVNGSNGIDGKDGEDGKDGLDGVGVQNAYIDFDNSLVIVLTSGQEINAGFLSQETKDAVVATFKQGAQTLNELLPVQTGNANKFLKTDGENVSWDTLDGSDINLASPPAIGGTTPNAATFTTLTATGQTSLGGTAGSESFRALNLASSVNWIESKGSIAGTGASGIPTLFVNGSDTTTQLGIGVKGASGYIKFFTSGAIGTEQFRVSGTASAVNYVQVTGGATGSFSLISAQGSDAVTGLGITSKGAARINFFNNNGVNRQVSIGGNGAAAVNYLDFNGSAAGIAPSIGVAGTDTNIGLNLTTKGTGELNLSTGSTNPLSLVVQDDVTAAPTPTLIYVINASSGLGRAAIRSSKALYLASASTNSIVFLTNGSKTAEGSSQFQVTNTTSAVNYVQVTGAATGGRPTISAQGSDTNLGLGLTTKGNGRHVFFNNNSTTSIQFSVGLAGTSTAVNYLNANGTVATTSPELTAEGTDTNLDIRLTPKGTGNVRFGAYTGTVSAITGYIEIKDAGGTIRRLAVVA